MMKKAMEEAFDGQTQCAKEPLVLSREVKANVRAVVGHDAFGAEGGAANVGGSGA